MSVAYSSFSGETTMRRYMVGLHDDGYVLDEDAIALSAETILDDIAKYCERRIRSEYAETER